MREFARAGKCFILLAACLTILALPVAQAAELGTLKHYKLPTSSDPHFVTTASDGNVWFTVQGAFNEETFQTPGQVARVTLRGDITEFDVCDSCITNDIVEGPDGILYISDNDGHLRRITTSGDLLSSVPVGSEVFGDPLAGIAADSTSICSRTPSIAGSVATPFPPGSSRSSRLLVSTMWQSSPTGPCGSPDSTRSVSSIPRSALS